MKQTVWLIILTGGVTALLKIIYGFFALWISAKNVFPGSGKPYKMAQILLSSIHVNAQFLICIMLITVLCILLVEQYVNSDQVIPLIATTIGYLLGRSFEDNFGPNIKSDID